MLNYVIERRAGGETETLNVLVAANSPDEAISKAFDMAKLVTGRKLPVDGEWSARPATDND